MSKANANTNADSINSNKSDASKIDEANNNIDCKSFNVKTRAIADNIVYGQDVAISNIAAIDIAIFGAATVFIAIDFLCNTAILGIIAVSAIVSNTTAILITIAVFAAIAIFIAVFFSIINIFNAVTISVMADSARKNMLISPGVR